MIQRCAPLRLLKKNTAISITAATTNLSPSGSTYSAAGVITQTSDVEIEVNGMMTYDRALLKMDEATIAKANKALYEAASRDAAKPGK